MKKRNYGIDLLRIVSMLMVIVLHLLGQGGILRNTELLSMKYSVAWFLEAACYCCVNCYAIISGYVGIESTYKHKNLLTIWLQTVFYTVLITLAFVISGKIELDISSLAKQFFPVYNEIYWYFTAYFAVYILTPAYNCIVNHLPYKELKKLLITCVIVFSLIPTVLRKPMFGLQMGSSFLWISMMYIIGAFLKRYHIQEKLTSVRWFLLYLVAVLASWGCKLFGELIEAESYGAMFIVNGSPLMLMAGIALVMFFSTFEFNGRWNRIIGILSASSFSVYLIHVHPLVWNHIVEFSCVWMAELSTLQMTGAVLIVSVGVYLACWIIDIPRCFLFRKYINKLTTRLFG